MRFCIFVHTKIKTHYGVVMFTRPSALAHVFALFIIKATWTKVGGLVPTNYETVYSCPKIRPSRLVRNNISSIAQCFQVQILFSLSGLFYGQIPKSIHTSPLKRTSVYYWSECLLKVNTCVWIFVVLCIKTNRLNCFWQTFAFSIL